MRAPLRRNNSSSRVVKKGPSQPGNNNQRRPQTNPRELHQKYLNMAREAKSAGNIIEAEQFYQHAEHYYRIAAERMTVQAASQQQPNNSI